MKNETTLHKSERIARKERRKLIASRKPKLTAPRQVRARTILRATVAERRTIDTPHGFRVINARTKTTKPTAPRYFVAWSRYEVRGMVRFTRVLMVAR